MAEKKDDGALLFAEETDDDVSEDPTPKSIWNIPGEGQSSNEYIIGDQLPSRRGNMPPPSILPQPSPAVSRSGLRQSRVLQRTSVGNSSLLEDQVRKTMSDFSDMVTSAVEAPHTPQSTYQPGRQDPPHSEQQPSSLLTSSAARKGLMEEDLMHTTGSMPGQASISIMLDQTGDTLNYDLTSRMDFTETHGGILTSPAPSRAVANFNYMDATIGDELSPDLTERLFFAFHDHFSSASEVSITDLVEYYQKECEDYTLCLRKCVSRGLIPVSARSAVRGWLTTCNRERFTWELIHRLYKNRLSDKGAEEGMDSDEVSVTVTSEYLSAEKLYRKDPVFREAKIVLKWLENMAINELSNCPLQVNYISESLRWENTLDTLNTGTKTPTLVQKMDPDACTREKRQLSDIDKKDDETLTRYLFMCIRAGDLQKAHNLCISVGQHWRAASLTGGDIYEDLNFDKKEISSRLKMPRGNKFRDLWKVTSWEMANKACYDPYERALYAALCGSLQPLLPVCASWYDHLWAHVRVVVDVQQEQELRSIVYRGRQRLAEMPSEYWDQNLSMDAIFQELKTSASQVVRSQSEDPYHVVQAYIILGDLQGLSAVLYNWLNTPLATPHLLRFMAHLMLFIRGVGVVMNESHCAAVLKAYIDYLTEEHQSYYMLVAIYAAALPVAMQVMCYASLLKNITKREAQEDCVKRGVFAGLDILACSKKVVEDVCRFDAVIEPMGSLLADSSNLSVAPTDADTKMLKSLKWLNFEDFQSREALLQSNRLMRMFLIQRKHQMLQRVFQQLPQERVKGLVTGPDEEDRQDLTEDTKNALREYLGFKAYVDALDTYDIWFRNFHSKPSPPDSGLRDTRGDQRRLDQKHYESKLHEWRTDVEDLSDEACNRLRNILLFPPCGWMVDEYSPTVASPSAIRRQEEMSWLRKLCIPRVCFLFHNVLNLTENYKESLQLADIIADESYKLYAEFRDSDLEEMLKMFAQSSICLLDKGADRLGYVD